MNMFILFRNIILLQEFIDDIYMYTKQQVNIVGEQLIMENIKDKDYYVYRVDKPFEGFYIFSFIRTQSLYSYTKEALFS